MLIPSISVICSIIYITFKWSQIPITAKPAKTLSIYRSVYEELGRIPNLDLKNESSIGLVYHGATPIFFATPLSLQPISPHSYCMHQYPDESEICLLIAIAFLPSDSSFLRLPDLPDRRNFAVRGFFRSSVLLDAIVADTPLAAEISKARQKISRASEISTTLGLDQVMEDLPWAQALLGGWGARTHGNLIFSPYNVFFKFAATTNATRNEGLFLPSETLEIFIDASIILTASWAFVYRGVLSETVPMRVQFGKCPAVDVADIERVVGCVEISANVDETTRRRLALRHTSLWVKGQIRKLHEGNAVIRTLVTEGDPVDKYPAIKFRELYAATLAKVELQLRSLEDRTLKEFWQSS